MFCRLCIFGNQGDMEIFTLCEYQVLTMFLWGIWYQFERDLYLGGFQESYYWQHDS